MPYKDPQKQKEYQQKHYQANKQLVYQRNKSRREEARQSSYDSLIIGSILDMKLWKLWIKDKDTNTSYDLSATESFILMMKRCFYCGEFATTLDRLDSTLTHTVENCVSCCSFCNQSKGAIDPKTFIFQAVYRRQFIYYDIDSDIWCDNKTKPCFNTYKMIAIRQQRSFELTKDQFDEFVVDKCHYCQRSPPAGKFFGIDKLVPDDGYVMVNCVTACVSCNRAKWDASVEEFTLRDERITQRYLAGYFDDMPSIPKNIHYYKIQ
jgi:5-methylcytosine-specific restriction endonuclease McrA